MNTLRRYQFRILPARVLARKAARRLIAPLKARLTNQRATQRQPYATSRDLPWTGPVELAHHLSPSEHVPSNEDSTVRSEIIAHVLGGKLYVLGCGWMHPWHGVEVPGFGEHRYHYGGLADTERQRGQWLCRVLPSAAVPRARWLWNSIEIDHQPIDWQRDFRSGYRWSESLWHQRIQLDPVPGADPKVPWELGRLQLLPFLAWEAAHTTDVSTRMQLARYIETILLDFAAQNPPGFGIQWRSSMDVAIRLANILVTLDLVASLGVRRATINAMLLYAYDHARFVSANLEWSEGMRANHYLACVAGLSVAAAYFPECPWTVALRQWCAREILQEAFYQFLPDGGNFEASLAYHRLSAEMLAWALWYLRRCPESRKIIDADPSIGPHLERIATFTLQTSYQSFVAPQIGDNDSGRFLCFHSNVEQWIPPHQWHGLPHPYCAQRSHGETYTIVCSALSEHRLPPPEQRGETPLRSPCYVAPDFGIAVLRSGPAEVVLRAGAIGQRGKGGHAHNDQLSVLLALDGAEVLVDPGTYVYLPSPLLRNRFRSTLMHNTLTLDGLEQNRWEEGPSEALFWMVSDRAAARIVARGRDSELFAEHRAYGVPHRRQILLSENRLLVRDWCPAPEALLLFHFHPLVTLRSDSNGIAARLGTWLIECTSDSEHCITTAPYSHSYGVCCSAPVLVVQPRHAQTQIEFRWERCS